MSLFIDLLLALEFPSARARIDEVDCVGIVGPFAHRPQSFGLDQLDAKRIGEAGDDFDLQLAELAALALEPVGPDMRAGFGRNQAGR